MENKKILIIDDDQSICRALSFKLEQEGYEVNAAHNGEEGLSLIETFAPDLVLLDIRMPTMTGPDMLERYNANPNAKKTRFIIVTNYDDMESLSQIFTHTVTDFVAKSTTPIDQLVELVKKRLK